VSGGLAEVAQADWDSLLAQLGCDDVYLARGYLEGARLLDPGEPVLLHLAGTGGDVVLTVLLRDAPGSAVDVTSPYGYGGPVALGSDPPVAEFYELYEAWCARRGAVSSFFRFHPLYGNAAAAGVAFHVERVGTTVSWRLDGDDDLLAGMHPTHRNKVRKAERSGADVELVEQPRDLGEFAQLYRATMTRLEAAEYYGFPDAYWDSLCGDLGDRVTLAGVRIGGELVAAALFLSGARWLHYHLSATSDPGRASGASNLMLLEVARYGRARGDELLHLGGGLGGREDSLFAFKAHFCPGRGLSELYVGKAVHDRAQYRELTGEAEVSYEGFFPAYRTAQR
jgi:hypothetical protein